MRTDSAFGRLLGDLDDDDELYDDEDDEQDEDEDDEDDEEEEVWQVQTPRLDFDRAKSL